MNNSINDELTISKDTFYTIDDLVKSRKRGWKNLATFYKDRFVSPDCDLDEEWKCETFWNRVWLLIEPKVEKLQTIKKKIRENVPLELKEYLTLNWLIFATNARPTLHTVKCDDGREKYRISLSVSPGIGDTPVDRIGNVLLAQPAYVLANQLQVKYSKPQFVQICHAPSCGKKFYTSRDIQKTCSRTLPGRRSDCKGRWESYQKWLLKIGKNPNEVWNNSKLKEAYINQHPPRGPQTKA